MIDLAALDESDVMALSFMLFPDYNWSGASRLSNLGEYPFWLVLQSPSGHAPGTFGPYAVLLIGGGFARVYDQLTMKVLPNSL